MKLNYKLGLLASCLSFVVSALLFIACSCSSNKTATIKGMINNYEQDVLYMQNYTSANALYKEEKHEIKLDENKEFEYTFNIEKPAYYKIGRTYLYLSPGDNITMTLDTRSRTNAIFEGKGAEANSYLTNLPYPKGGSFWGHPSMRKGQFTYKELPGKFKSIKEEMLGKLLGLKNLSESFIKLEKARLNFEYANSLRSIFYLYYAKVARGEMTEEEMGSKMKAALEYYVPFVKEALSDYNSTDYLQFEVFQSLLYDLKRDDYRKTHQLPKLCDELNEYLLVSKLIDGMSNQESSKGQLTDYSQKIKNKDYLAAIEKIQKKYGLLNEGSYAIDLTFTNFKGDSIKLIDYIGDVIVVDIWATWCGPCMKEKPFFEELAQKYKNEDVTFLTVSIDKKKVWESYFKNHEVSENQLHIYRDDLSAYQLKGIPRFFVIDRDFKIVDVFAPRPSSGELEKLINKVLEK